MSTRSHVHEESFATPPEVLFALLHTPSAIRAWWGAARVIVIPQAGGVWAATWGEDEDDPEYATTATMAVFDPPRRIVFENYTYKAKAGPLPFEAEFVTEFAVSDAPEGASLRVTQSGFPADSIADEFYAGCQKGWADTFAGIRRYLESTAN